jgi:hypothetical protein
VELEWYDLEGREGGKKRAQKKKVGDGGVDLHEAARVLRRSYNFHVFSVPWSARRGEGATAPKGKQEV